MQLYFYDTDETIAHRTRRSPHLDADLIRKILGILQINPYVQCFKSLGTMGNLQEYNITLNTTISVDQRRFNAPAKEQVAAIWMDGNDLGQRFQRSIVVYGKSEHPFYIRPYHGCYDPLGYPFFFHVVKLDGKIRTYCIEKHHKPSQSEHKRNASNKVYFVLSILIISGIAFD